MIRKMKGYDDVIEIAYGVDEIEALDNLLPQYAGCDLTTIEVDEEGIEYLDIYHPDGHFKVAIVRPTCLNEAATNELWQTLTATEAAGLWELNTSTIRRACLEGRLNCRKSGATWLIDKDEMYRVYGDPPLDSDKASSE